MAASPPPELMAKVKPEARAIAIREWDDVRTELSLEGWAECATRRSPENIRMIAFTNVDSPEERVLLRDLAPLLGSCIPEGVSFKMPIAVLRGPLMIAYVRLAYPLSSYAATGRKQ
jgi:hypothetical protein